MNKYDYIHSTVDIQVSTAPVTIACIIITPRDTKKGDITLYDGESASDPKIMAFRSLAGQSLVVNFVPGLLTKRGLYLDVGGDVENVFIQFTWGKE